MSGRVEQARDELLAKGRPGEDAPSLFPKSELPLAWEMEWQSMPEFLMQNTEPFQKVTVSFRSWEDVVEFGNLIGQSVGKRTDSIWFPAASTDYIAPKNFRYIDES